MMVDWLTCVSIFSPTASTIWRKMFSLARRVAGDSPAHAELAM